MSSQLVRVYASLLGTHFELTDDNIVVATRSVEGQAVSDITADTDPLSLVGSGSGSVAEATTIAAGERFKFRMPNPIVVKSDTGARLAYLVRV